MDDWVQQSFQNMANEQWRSLATKQAAAAAATASASRAPAVTRPTVPAATAPQLNAAGNSGPDPDGYTDPSAVKPDGLPEFSKDAEAQYGGFYGEMPTKKPLASQPSKLGGPPPPKSLVDEVRATYAKQTDQHLLRIRALSEDKTGLPDFRGETDPNGKRLPASIRYNNPGAQWPGPSADKFGAVESVTLNDRQKNKIAVFPDAVSGAAAHFDLLARSYVGKSLDTAITRWSGGNHSAAYAVKVAQSMGMSLKDKLTPELFNNPDTAIRFAKTMSSVEAGKAYPLSDDQWRMAWEKFRDVNAKISASKK